MAPPSDFWNDRYAEPGFAYGTEPNAFLASVIDRLPRGPLLSLGAGEGRNEAFLAECGFDVTAVDSSRVGLDKAARLAAERGARIEVVEADLGDFPIEPEAWAAVVSIFCHLPPDLRRDVHRRAVHGLRRSGALVLEAYGPGQLGRGTGGPPAREMLYALDDLRADLAGLRLERAAELEREVVEGRFHTGLASVVQVLGFEDRRAGTP